MPDSSGARDPLEERDILKILDGLDDYRVQKKILSITKMEVLKMAKILKEDEDNADQKT